MEAQLPIHYNKETSGSSHSNLDPMKVIMQELQLMRKDMKEMRGNITNLSMEHRDQSNIGGYVTSHTQWGYGNFSSYARSYEHNSYDCYESNRLGTRNGHNDRTYNTVPRNEVRNGGNYMKVDERFHKRKGDIERYLIVMIIMSIAMVVRTCIMSIMIVITMEAIKCEVVNHERQGQGQSKVKFMELSMVKESLQVKELSQAKIEEGHE
ncbi:hypothetical protein M9H77_22827 [Catharanthus roseus]|uniref:Uncharacterized protein n=1 Tax=Catharanthus roseus TaxID=4058 RepID=A0ACC0ARJ4_CATRO|nr:hypothetical protein M9H77_22827 [Catharanthus roseus]